MNDIVSDVIKGVLTPLSSFGIVSKIIGAVLMLFGALFLLGFWFNKENTFVLELVSAPILLYFGFELLK